MVSKKGALPHIGKIKVSQTLGVSQFEVADKLGVHKDTICRDIKKIRKEWARQVSNIDLISLFMESEKSE